MARRIVKTEVAQFTAAILKRQEYRCPLCGNSLKANASKEPVLDHCHDSGLLRGVLCRNCNGNEGRVNTLAIKCAGKAGARQWLANLVEYLARTPYPFFHYTHKTEEEKRLARNKVAREKRAKAKAAQ